MQCNANYYYFIIIIFSVLLLLFVFLFWTAFFPYSLFAAEQN